MLSNLARNGGWAFVAAGLLWFASYGADLVSGSQTGRTIDEDGPLASLAAWILSVANGGSLLLIGLGLVGVHARLRRREKGPGRAGVLLACLAIAAAAAVLVLSAVAPFELTPVSRLAATAGIFSGNIGATLLAIAALQWGGIPRRAAVALTLVVPLFVALMALLFATFPVVVPSILSRWAVVNLPFPIVGVLWIAAGWPLLADTASAEAGPARGTAPAW